MNFPSIDIQGSILSAELLSKIRAEQANFQLDANFNSAYKKGQVKDEISLAWQDTKAQWTIFNNKLKRLKEGETGATETRQFWIIPLLANFGYDFQFLKSAEELNGKSFWINFREQNIGGFPLYIAGFNESLDKRPENKSLRVSPHALVQEYLNYSEHLYGLVTNGKQIRLLRDASRLTRLSYVEFNLEKIMEEDLYSDFVILYRLLHISRMPQTGDGGAESIIEKYHQEGLEAGATIRNKLGDSVKATIANLAEGFVNHPENKNLRDLIAANTFNTDEYYKQMLRIIYRVLYLFVIEERNLVYAESKEKETKRFNQIYFNHYSLLRLRKLAKRIAPPDAAHHYDLWMSLVNTFALFEKSETGKKMGLMALQGDLFSYNAIASNQYDLHENHLANDVLFKAIKALGYFETDKQVLIAVNYGGLDVEEFGSVYEGLLELKLKIEPIPGSDKYTCTLTGSSERSKSGSHYTPEELVQPLIKHSLQYIIDERKEKPDAEQQLLDIKVCDVACGSGHILLSAARKIALELACIRETTASNSKEKVEQPSPMYLRQAMRDVIRNCIYGVDKNPLAVELCKVALWLEAHNPNEPLNFLDHHIKCGDAIVGLAHREELENGIADEAFKTLPGDDKDISSTYAKQNKAERKERVTKELQIKADFEASTAANVQEAMEEYKSFNKLSENTPEEIEAKQRAYKKFLDGKGFTFLKTMADSQVAQFFIPKTAANKDKLITDNEYRQILAGQKGWQGQKTAMATSVALEKRIFHWFLEFPEIFQKGGFECILGNPPYLGGSKVSTHYGDSFNLFIKTYYSNSTGKCDLVAYFFLRAYNLLNLNSYFSFITTDTISQGDTRAGGLDVLIRENATINFALKSIKWPGVAAVSISLLSIHKGLFYGNKFLNNRLVKNIGALLEDSIEVNPYSLANNNNLCFKGVDFGGDGFILNNKEATELKSINSQNYQIIHPLQNGNDLSNQPDQSPSRFIINFQDFSIEKASTFKECFKIVEELVKPERINSKDNRRKNKWWLFGRDGGKLNSLIQKLNHVFILTRNTKYIFLVQSNKDIVFSDAIVVFAFEDFEKFTIVHSTIHNEWAWKYASRLGDSTIRYSNTETFETFPFPKIVNNIESKLAIVGKEYNEFRRLLMLELNLGITKTYNAFHTKDLSIAEIQKASKKDEPTCEKAYDDVIKLRGLHKQMDETVLEAYGWSDIKLQHDFYEVEYLPENDRVRYTIHPDARKEVLKRLLELNHTIYEEEIKQGLHKEEDVKKFYEQKGQPIPPEVIAIMDANKIEKKVKDKKVKSKKSTANEGESIYKQPGLFEEDNLFNLGEKD
jgi:hypothetical protein